MLERSFCRAASWRPSSYPSTFAGVSILVRERARRPGYPVDSCDCCRSGGNRSEEVPMACPEVEGKVSISESLASALFSRGEGRWRIEGWPFTGP